MSSWQSKSDNNEKKNNLDVTMSVDLVVIVYQIISAVVLISLCCLLHLTMGNECFLYDFFFIDFMTHVLIEHFYSLS